MMKNNRKLLASYLLGLIASFIITLILGVVFDHSPLIVSILTSLVALHFIYMAMWRFGREDNEKGNCSLINCLFNLVYFLGIVIIIALIILICRWTGAQAGENAFLQIGLVWFYPFTGFYPDAYYMTVTPVITAVIILVSVAGYLLGAKEISIYQKVKSLLSKLNRG